jgi:3-oxoadipate enol-lactonase
VLVLGPSLGTDTGLFDAQVAAFADRLQIVRYDLRGHGASEVVPGPCTMADLAADVLALLDRLGVERFSYAGVSIGGAIGQQLALTVPERLERLAIIASAAQFADPPSWATRAALVRAEGTGAMVGSRKGVWYTEDFASQQPDEVERLLEMLRGTAAEGYAGCCEAIGMFDAREFAASVKAPTIAIAGAEDPATPPTMVRQIADTIPGAEFVTVDGAAHLLNVERPDEFSALLARHLEGAAQATV